MCAFLTHNEYLQRKDSIHKTNIQLFSLIPLKIKSQLIIYLDNKTKKSRTEDSPEKGIGF